MGREEEPSPQTPPETPPPSSPTARGQDPGAFDYTGSLRDLADRVEGALASAAEAHQRTVGIGILRFINKTGVALDVDGLTRALTLHLRRAGHYTFLHPAQVDRLLVDAHLSAEVLIEKESFDVLAGKAERDFLLVTTIWGNQRERIFQSRLISLRDGRVREEVLVHLR